VTDPADAGGGRYERISSCELHRLAVCRARRNVDIRFFWQLIDALPSGDLDEVEAEAVEPLRPMYIEYLTRKG
jgi:hypothetical protein